MTAGTRSEDLRSYAGPPLTLWCAPDPAKFCKRVINIRHQRLKAQTDEGSVGLQWIHTLSYPGKRTQEMWQPRASLWWSVLFGVPGSCRILIFGNTDANESNYSDSLATMTTP